MTKKPTKPKKPKRAVIPAATATVDGVYDILARDLGLPKHFGRNLDALYDALTGDVAGPVEIVVEDAKALRRALGPAAAPLLKALADAAKARRDLTVHLR